MKDYKLLIERAKAAQKNSYAPYSSFNVGAALLTKDGKIYTGCNIENASYSPTMCAERVAFFKAISAGEREFVAIAIVGANKDEQPSRIVPPCGVCRQVMSEFCGSDFMIVLGTRDKMELVPFADMMPFTFTASDLSSAPAESEEEMGENCIDLAELSDELDEELYSDEEIGDLCDLDGEMPSFEPQYPVVEEFFFGED